MAKHIQTQTEWESTMARRIMDQLRGELYLDQRYLNAALGALPPAPLPPGTTGAAFAAIAQEEQTHLAQFAALQNAQEKSEEA